MTRTREPASGAVCSTLKATEARPAASPCARPGAQRPAAVWRGSCWSRGHCCSQLPGLPPPQRPGSDFRPEDHVVSVRIMALGHCLGHWSRCGDRQEDAAVDGRSWSSEPGLPCPVTPTPSCGADSDLLRPQGAQTPLRARSAGRPGVVPAAGVASLPMLLLIPVTLETPRCLFLHTEPLGPDSYSLSSVRVSWTPGWPLARQLPTLRGACTPAPAVSGFSEQHGQEMRVHRSHDGSSLVAALTRAQTQAQASQRRPVSRPGPLTVPGMEPRERRATRSALSCSHVDTGSH